MCRIAGIIDHTKTEAELRAKVKMMCDAMAHGGPDDEGFYIKTDIGLAFGHRRLALIDLSAAGHQPMIYQERYIISFNGEIYNYRELKAELLNLSYEFKSNSDTEVILAAFAKWGVKSFDMLKTFYTPFGKSNSDTEVILAAFAKWGVKSFDMLKGMFAFALYDTVENISYLVRDSAGIKPLYFSTNNQHLVFASEVRAFKKIDYQYTENRNWKIYFLAFGHIPEPYTTFAEIEMLPKGNYLKWQHENQTFEIISYQIVSEESVISDAIDAVKLVKKTLQEAVRKHLYSDAPIGAFLSGGIDSSIISILADNVLKNNSSLHTLAINFEEAEYSEQPYQDIISKQIKSIHQEYKISKEVFEAQFPNALNAMDQPTTDGINSWFISYFAKQNGLKAVLSGIGADELFGGYPSFKRMKWIERLSSLPNLILKQGLRLPHPILKRAYYLSYKNTCGKYLFLRGFFNPKEIASILNCSIAEVDTALKTAKIGELPEKLEAAEKASWLEYNLYMQNQLLKDTDAMSMQHGVEVRVPFLDKDLVQLVHHIESNVAYQTEKPKGLLIDAFKNVLPEKIWNRKKMGFTFPFQKWLATDHQFLNRFSGCQNERVNAFVEDFKQGKLHWSKMMALYQVVD